MDTTTETRILTAAINLFSRKTYSAVTTREIAKEAGVNEVTIFRYFGHKRTIFEQAFDRFMFSHNLSSIFENELEGKLEKDLLKISHVYQEHLNNNKKILLMHFRDDQRFPDSVSPVFVVPRKLKSLLVNYFTEMQQRGVITQDPESIAVNFLAANFGIFVFFAMQNQLAITAEGAACVELHVKTFVNGVSVKK